MRIPFCYFLFLFLSFIFVFSHVGESQAEKSDDGEIYVVYMGAATASTNKNKHTLLLSSLFTRKKSNVVHNYEHGFTGFAARLSETEAQQLANHPGVVSVFPDPVFNLHTTRSWDFLLDETALLIDSHPRSTTDLPSKGSDTIIGILDTGIWPESESFNDKGMGPIPSRWKGTCMAGQDFNSSNCNRKLIGARYYDSQDSESTTVQSARDAVGHGTHVASTAAGAAVPNASYYGIATGLAKGGSPASRIAMYRVCSSDGCRGSAIMAAFDDAIADGVDLLSLSLGSSSLFAPDFSTDPIAIGAFHAVQKGITVVCSAGNEGPSPQTVVNVAPWILTVAATTIDRDFESDIVLGNNKVIKGEAINFSDLQKSPIYPLIDGASAKASSAREDEARKCYPDSMDADMIKGKIVLCQHNDTLFSMKEKLLGVKTIGGVGVVFVSDKARLIASKSGSLPMTAVSTKDGEEVLEYIKSTRNPNATILATETITNYKPAPTVAYFSARGPSSSYGTQNILKPDIAAPGVNILAAWIGNDTAADTTPTGKEPPHFNLLSGTSMSCPHVAGVAATIKSQNPTWSPSAIRSAIMTTAIQSNNLKEPITTDTGEVATPYDIGAGEVNPTGGIQPGLVYEVEPADYLLFLCYYGYNISNIKLISGQLPEGFTCPKNSSTDMISDINYPSIAVSKNVTKPSVTVTRTVTNVDIDKDTSYTVSVDAPKGLEVTVVPVTLKFTASTKKLSYQVTFSSSARSSVEGGLFGAITWTNGKYKVRSPFVVSSTLPGH